MSVIANFTYMITAGSPPIAPFTVAFTDTSTGSPNSWIWDFGDGFTSELQNPTHQYTVSGSYTVTLKAYIQTGSVDIAETDVSARSKNSTRLSTNAAAYANWLATSWTPISPPFGTIARWTLDRNGSGFLYQAAETTHDYDLTPYSSGVALLQVNFQPPDENEGNVKTDTNFSPSATFPSGTFFTVEDVSSSIGGTPRRTWLDASGNLQISDPALNKLRGYRVLNTRVRVWAITSQDSISIPLIPLAVDFVGVPRFGKNIQTVNFTDLSTSGVTAWSWRKRKAGTTDAFVEFATIQNPSHNFDKDNP